MRAPISNCSHVVSLLAMVALAACGGEPSDTTGSGALVAVSMKSTVGVLLDEVPAPLREPAAANFLARTDEFWLARARMQIEATSYRLTYRNFFYDDRGQLPLPPAASWQLVVGTAERRSVDGHDVIAVDYTLRSTLLTSSDQPGLAEPLLAETGGVWDEELVLPIDPDLLLERTGLACMDEADFPPRSVDTENARFFYDDQCEAGPDPEGCHLSEPVPDESCVEAVERAIGRVETAVHFERLAWDADLAAAVRLGEQRPGGAQLAALGEGLDDRRIIYRYIDAGSCAIAEGCVGGSGWRRLLQFTATVQNLGAEDAAIGDVGPGSPAVENRLVSPSECHQHMHFNHYGHFSLGDDDALGGKRAFCLESTARYFNNEETPLVHPFSCAFQGTAAGWGDDYIAGLDCQWIDITDFAAGGGSAELAFDVNPDHFLCEGEVVRDDDGAMTFEDTTFENEAGELERRIACEPFADADADNRVTREINVPVAGGMVTAACTRGTPGERRNCGFRVIADRLACDAGQPVIMRCELAAGGEPQVVRVCERSEVLDQGVACTYLDAMASGTVLAGTVELTTSCPAAREGSEPGGAVTVYAAPALDGAPVDEITCSVVL